MNIVQNVRPVIQNIRARKGRSVLTMLGIVIGVAGVVTIIALGAGAQSLVLSQISSLGSNLVGVLPGKSNDKGPPAAVFGISVTTLTAADAEAVGKLPSVVAVAGFARGSANVRYGNREVDTNITGTQASYTTVQNAEVEQGRFFDTREELGANVAVLGVSVADDLFPDVSPIGKVIKVGQVPLEVIGVLKKRGTVAFQNQDDQVFMPLGVAQQQLLGIRHLNGLRAKVDRPENIKVTIEDIQQLLMVRHGIKDPNNIDFSVRDLADAIKLLTTITNALRAFLALMAAISLVVGGIGIMNIMLVTVAERTREIGLRKAVGATSQEVRNQFLVESSVLTGLGGLGGVVLGALLSYAAALAARSQGYTWDFSISLLSVALAIGVSVLTGMVFGLYPARKASRLEPVEALRYE